MLFGNVLEFLAIAACYGADAASVSHASRSASSVKEHVAVPLGWEKHHARVDKSRLMDMKIGLVRPHIKQAQAHLHRISNPKHVDYGKHLSMSEVKKLFAPARESVDRVLEWLDSHDISRLDVKQTYDFINVRIPVSKAEQMLDAEYNAYHNKGSKVVRSLKYSLPNHLHEHIDLIQPTTMFGSMHAHSSDVIKIDDGVYSPARGNPAYTRADPAYNVTIASLRELYNIGNYSAINPNTSVAVASYLEEYANFDDFRNFTDKYVSYIPSNSSLFNVTSIQGGENLQNLSLAGSEAGLDVQYAFGMVGSVAQQTVFTTAGSPPFQDDLVLNGTNTNEPYLDFVTYLLADNYTSNNTVPQVISTSYGDDEQSVPESYARRVCDGFMSLGLLGTSVIFSSGDSGVGPGGNVTGEVCIGNLPGSPNYNKTVFLPAFPASCPYVTVVGGTTRQDPEVAVEILDRSNTTSAGFFSGGGFSNYFPTPDYQNDSVAAYLPSIPANYTGLYNASGRGYPDVSTQSWRYRVFIGGNETLIGGTSASSPTFAGIVGLLNDARATNGLPTLGFLNPLLYSLQNATSNGTATSSSSASSPRATTTARVSFANGTTPFNDVVVGSNPGCGTNGFAAAPGWDPVTGLGSPNFIALVNATGGSV